MKQMQRSRRRAALAIIAGLTGSVLAPSCEVRLHDAANAALRDYVFSLLDPTNIVDLIDDGSDDAAP